MSNYIPFHTHDCLGSLLDSTLKLEDYVNWAVANSIPAIGVTNHGELTSSLKLINLCKKHNIKPLIGIEFYVTENKLDEKGNKIRDNHHLCVLAKNENGYHNLIKLHNLSWKNDRRYHDPRIMLQDLLQYKEDLIVTSACIGGVLGKPFLNGDLEKAENILKLLHQEFQGDFYLELQEHNSFKDENRIKQTNYNKWLIKMGKKYNIKCIIQQDAHYYLKEDWEAHQVLLCKNTGSKLSKPAFSFDSHEYYLKNEAEILEAFREYPLQFIEECFKNTSEIANKIEEFEIANEKYTMPNFGDKKDVCDKLKQLTKKGFIKRFGSITYNKEYIDRIKYEFEIIEKMDMQDYVYMLYDIYKYAKDNGIYRSYGRGSMGASLILYCLGITQLDPVKYNLMIERFISPDRISMMDADCDWSPDDKPKIEKYLRDKYGWENVCGIATYNELTAKSAFKAVASALDVSFDVANKASSFIDSNLSLKENFEQNNNLQDFIKEKNLQKVFNISLVIEGTYSARGQHPCANVIFPKSFNELCPVVTMKDPNNSKERVFVTSYNMKEIDGELRFLKQDCLGLRNIQIIREADKIIKERHGIQLDFHKININDELVYKKLSEGDNIGVFQFESSMFKSLLKEVKPTCLEDLAVITAIGRPSALQSGLTQQYKDIRAGKLKEDYIIPELKEPLKDTFGLMIFQESMMLTLKYYAGFTNSQADVARKICGKKLKDKIPELKNMFIEGVKKMNRDMGEAEDLFEKIQQFASYGFSKIHGLLYSLMSYATAWYKTYYTVEYMCALLNSVTDDLDKLNLYISECYRLGINIIPPDINVSGKYFNINDKNEIVFSLNSIKGLGSSAVNNIILAREQGPFKSIMDFIDRTSKVDKSALQALLKVGAFNSIEKNTKRWCMMCEHLNDAKKSKFYEESLDIERSIYELLGTRLAKKSEKYKDIVDIKRTLGSSRKNLQQKEELNIQQNNIIETYIENVNKHFLQYTTFSAKEKMINEQELLGFNISVNPYKRWNDFKKFFISNVGNKNLQYIELDDLMSNAEKYYDLEEFYTVGMLSDIKEIKTKKGQKMAKLTVECYGTKTTITVFPKVYENGLQNNLQKGNMVAITGTLVETNKQYTDEDYEIRFENIRQLNVLINENNKCIIDLDGKDRSKIDFSVKNFAYNEWKQNLPIEKCVMYRINGKYLILNGLCWINNPNKLLESIK